VSGVGQVPYRCPDQCQEWSRYPAGAPTSVRSGAESGLLSFRLSASQGASLGDFLLAPACPIEKVTLWVSFLVFTPVDDPVMDDGYERSFSESPHMTDPVTNLLTRFLP